MGYRFFNSIRECVKSALSSDAQPTPNKSSAPSLENTDLRVSPELESAVNEALGTNASQLGPSLLELVGEVLTKVTLSTDERKACVMRSKQDENVIIVFYGDESATLITFEHGSMHEFDKREGEKQSGKT